MASSAPPGPFGRFSPDDVRDLIAAYPLAWVCTADARTATPALLPLLGEQDADGRTVRLIGHMARRNPLAHSLQEDPAAKILFSGPQGYVSPAEAENPAWVPTWNYAQLSIDARIVFEPERTDAALAMLVDHMEQDRPVPWSVEDTGPRYGMLAAQVIGFRAEITELRGRFKLAQDENETTLRAILRNHRDPALVAWMERMNRARLAAGTV